MAVVTQHAAGAFCWVELATTDAADAKRFYAQVFGWQAHDVPLPDGGVYTMMKLNGRAAAALYGMDPAQAAQAPPHWSSYVSVPDVKTCAARALELDGTVVVEPFDVMEHGSMAVLRDPAGAMLSVWQPRVHIGVGVRDEPGALCWNELLTREAGAATAFYSALFGWTPRAFGGPVMGYTEFLLGDRPIAGMTFQHSGIRSLEFT